jgi:hypothetical protein
MLQHNGFASNDDTSLPSAIPCTRHERKQKEPAAKFAAGSLISNASNQPFYAGLAPRGIVWTTFQARPSFSMAQMAQ